MMPHGQPRLQVHQKAPYIPTTEYIPVRQYILDVLDMTSPDLLVPDFFGDSIR